MEKSYITSNNIKIFSYAMPNLHSFCLSLNIKAGKIYEETLEITHLLEHMFFRRLNDLSQSELYKKLDKYGIYFNATTSKGLLRFEMSGSMQFFNEACGIFTKLLAPPSFTDEELKIEQKRIYRELKEEDYTQSIGYLAEKEMWKGTPLDKFDSPSAIKKITLAKLKKEREKIFTADNMFFYVTGAVSEENLRYFYNQIEAFPIVSNATSRDRFVAVPFNFCRRLPDIVTKKSAQYNYVLIGFDYETAKYAPQEINLLYDILFTGNSALFYHVMSEQNALIYDYDACIERYTNIGRLFFSYEIAIGDLYKSLKLSIETLRLIKTEISDFDFERIKVDYVDNAVLKMDDADGMNWSMSYDNHILSYGYTDLNGRKKLYEKVTKERLRTIAEEIFTAQNMTVAIRAVKNPDIDLIKEIVSTI